MFRDITIGQYYPADSLLHYMDPRVKLMGTLVWIIALFVMDNIPSFILVTGFLILIIRLSHVPFSFMAKGLRSIMILVLIAAIFNIFFTPGNAVFEWKAITITDAGIYNAVIMMVRMFYLIIGSAIMTLTTTPNNLTDGLETALAPLSALHVPVHEIAMMMSIALRFIPILIDETNKIMKAQMARGADFESGNIITKAKNMIPLLVPLFVSAFRRANDLALAMEARCYSGGDGRTKMNPLHYTGNDLWGYAALGIFLAGTIALKVLF